MNGRLVSHLRKACWRVGVESKCRVWTGGSVGLGGGRGPFLFPSGGREQDGWVPYLIKR